MNWRRENINRTIEETNKKKRLQSLRGLAGLYIRTDKKGDKYAEVAIICNAPGSRATTRKENIKKRGKEILNLIEELAKGEDCKYMALKALFLWVLKVLLQKQSWISSTTKQMFNPMFKIIQKLIGDAQNSFFQQ